MSALPGARAVVFGGSGFLGSRVAAALLASGVETVVFDLVEPSGRDLTDAEFLAGDILDAEAVRSAVTGAGSVFAFAGRAGAAASVSDPIGDLDSSCKAQLILLESVRELAHEAAVVFPGSRLEYGRAEYVPMDERHPLKGDTPYAVHKSACAAYYSQYAERFGLRTCVLRFGNPYGPHPLKKAFAGFGILNHFVDLALRGETIELFGGGGQLRDFLYVDDAVRAIMLAAERAPAGSVFNIGTGEGISLAEAAREVVAATGSGDISMAPWPAEYESVETGDYFFDASEAERVLGWRATTSLAEGLRATVDSVRTAV